MIAGTTNEIFPATTAPPVFTSALIEGYPPHRLPRWVGQVANAQPGKHWWGVSGVHTNTRQVCASWARAALIAGACFIIAAEPTVATPLSYDEAISGDLPGGAPFPVLPLDVGVNTVTGTSDFDAASSASLSADFDDFEFTVPASTQLVSVGFASNVTSVSGSPAWMRIETFIDTGDGSTALACQENWVINQPSFSPACLVPPSSPNGTFETVMPLDAGTYLLFMGQFDASSPSVTDFNYTWTLTVASVPEPSSVAALVSGLAVLGTLRFSDGRKRRATRGGGFQC